MPRGLTPDARSRKQNTNTTHTPAFDLRVSVSVCVLIIENNPFGKHEQRPGIPLPHSYLLLNYEHTHTHTGTPGFSGDPVTNRPTVGPSDREGCWGKVFSLNSPTERHASGERRDSGFCAGYGAVCWLRPAGRPLDHPVVMNKRLPCVGGPGFNFHSHYPFPPEMACFL